MTRAWSLLVLAALPVAAQSTASVSGVIRYQGAPLAGVRVNIIWQGGSVGQTTGADGRYGYDRVPTGNFVQLLVTPPAFQPRLAPRFYALNGFTANLVRDFELGPGRLFTAEVRGPDGGLFTGAAQVRFSPIDNKLPSGEGYSMSYNGGRFSVVAPPGRYSFSVQAPPYFADAVEVNLTESDVEGLIVRLVERPTATVRGVVRAAGLPAAGISILSYWPGSGRSLTTDENGAYQIAGVPLGGSFTMEVNPAPDRRLVRKYFRVPLLSGDLTQDFDLTAGYQLRGEVRTAAGQRASGSMPLNVEAVARNSQPGDIVVVDVREGFFHAVLPPDRYLLRVQSAPYYSAAQVVDLRAADALDVVITADGQRGRPYETAPPRAGLITVGAADADGVAEVRGAGGAVTPGAEVGLINLNSRSMAVASADASGAFSARLFAPPGSRVLVKADRYVSYIAELYDDALSPNGPNMPPNTLPLPGTIVYAGEPPKKQGEAQMFDTAGALLSSSPRGWAGWWFSGAMELLPATPGAGRRLKVTGRVRITSPAMNCASVGRPNLGASFLLLPLFDANGRVVPSRNNGFRAQNFTSTGLPIERETQGATLGLGPAQFGAPACVSEHTLDAALEATVTMPAGVEDGVYMPLMYLQTPPLPLDPKAAMAKVWGHMENESMLPPVRVGAPATPRIPWSLFTDYAVNGQRGATAREDLGRYQLATRVMLEPHHLVLPRVEERTGRSAEYRLDPGSPWLGSSDRAQPYPSPIPLALPSGSLTVQVVKPDGSADTLGPAPIRQFAVRTPSTPGGHQFTQGSGSLVNIAHVSTMDDAFRYSFSTDGLHTITLRGSVDDVYGNSYAVEGTYDVEVGRVLDIDAAVLPAAPHLQGDVFNAGVHLWPPVAADVTVRFTHMPASDPARAWTRVVEGRANRFGHFQPGPEAAIRLDSAGEYRVDITATYLDTAGMRWTGTATWGNVVEGAAAQLEAHGRRGMDFMSDRLDDMPAWFETANLPADKVGAHHHYPYFSGDVAWGMKMIGPLGPGDSITPVITFRDNSFGGKFYQLLRDNSNGASFRAPPSGGGLTALNKRIAVGEAPLVMTTFGEAAKRMNSPEFNLLGYWYATSEKADVRVHEVISEDAMGAPYWRFGETYGYQLGQGARGDEVGDLKWEFGGVVFRVPAKGIAEYAAYASLWVLAPDDDPLGPRVSPPFQDATGASINGGPILKLNGEDVDLLFLPKGVRPGDVFEVGEAVAVSGHVGPPLDSAVGVTIVSPSGKERTGTLRANRIGWVYDPGFDFAVDEPGVWTVRLNVKHDRAYVGNGMTPSAHNTGTVMGSGGSFQFYAVAPGAARLPITAPAAGFLQWKSGGLEPVEIRGQAPAGTTSVAYTVFCKGAVLAQGALKPAADGSFLYNYDARALARRFPFISNMAREGWWDGLSDLVAIRFLATGGEAMAANTVTLLAEEVHIGEDPQ